MGEDRSRFEQWQNAAVNAWMAARGTGVVEAVTGSGKTHVAFNAIRRLRSQHRHVYPLIVVPTIPLLHQWKHGLEKQFLGTSVGLIGDGNKQTFGTPVNGRFPSAVVSTIQSAVQAYDQGLMSAASADGAASLLVVDECHHVQSPNAMVFNRLLRKHFDYKLGLTATADRYVVQGLGQIVYEYNLKTAVNDGVLPKFTILNVAVSLNPAEVRSYLELEDEAGQKLQQIKSLYGLFGINGRPLSCCAQVSVEAFCARSFPPRRGPAGITDHYQWPASPLPLCSTGQCQPHRLM